MCFAVGEWRSSVFLLEARLSKWRLCKSVDCGCLTPISSGGCHSGELCWRNGKLELCLCADCSAVLVTVGGTLVIGLAGTLLEPLSEDERKAGILNWVGWSINQDGRSVRWPAGVLCTVDGVILVPAPFGSPLTWWSWVTGCIMDDAESPFAAPAASNLFERPCKAGPCHHSAGSFVSCCTGVDVTCTSFDAACNWDCGCGWASARIGSTNKNALSSSPGDWTTGMGVATAAGSTAICPPVSCLKAAYFERYCKAWKMRRERGCVTFGLTWAFQGWCVTVPFLYAARAKNASSPRNTPYSAQTSSPSWKPNSPCSSSPVFTTMAILLWLMLTIWITSNKSNESRLAENPVCFRRRRNSSLRTCRSIGFSR